MKMSTCANFERFLACKLGGGGLCQLKLMYTQLISAEIKLGLTSFFPLCRMVFFAENTHVLMCHDS